MHNNGHGSVYMQKIVEGVEQRICLLDSWPDLRQGVQVLEEAVWETTDDIVRPALKTGTAVELEDITAMLADEEKEKIVRAHIGQHALDVIEAATDGYHRFGVYGNKVRLGVRRGGVHVGSSMHPSDSQQTMDGKKYVPPGTEFRGKVDSFAALPKYGGYICIRSGLRYHHILGLVDPQTAESRVNLDLAEKNRRS
jgi:hypothetical protein